MLFSRTSISDVERIDGRRQDTQAAVEQYFVVGNTGSTQRFLGLTLREVQAENEAILEEISRSASMDVFGALEAAFRVDFLQRCYCRERDVVSRAFRDLYQDKGAQVSLEDDILATWSRHSSVPPSVIADLRSAFKYRHWLAHGRYWRPRFPRLDYDEIYTLAEETLGAFPFREG